MKIVESAWVDSVTFLVANTVVTSDFHDSEWLFGFEKFLLRILAPRFLFLTKITSSTINFVINLHTWQFWCFFWGMVKTWPPTSRGWSLVTNWITWLKWTLFLAFFPSHPISPFAEASLCNLDAGLLQGCLKQTNWQSRCRGQEFTEKLRPKKFREFIF